MSEGVDHLNEWMKLQEETNREIVKALVKIDQRLKEMHEKIASLDERTLGLVRF